MTSAKFTRFTALAIGAIMLILIVMGMEVQAHAEEWTDDEIVSAIWAAEGGYRASKPYGIMRAECTWANESWCRLACYQTVQNNRKRYAQWGHKEFDSYLEFLSSRYAPIGANNDPKGLNKYWLKNVRLILAKNRGAK